MLTEGGEEVMDIEKSERDLREEGKKITTLQDSLQQTNQLCNDMIKQLDQFEARVTAMEPIMMPLYRNLSTISRVYGNVDSTLSIVRMLAEKNEMAKREEFILANGPTMDNLDGYLASIQRVQEGRKEIKEANLGFCEITIRRLETTHGIALDALSSKYKEWLSEATTIGGDSGGGGSIPLDLSQHLMQIATFAASSSDQLMSDVLGYYGEVRSHYLMNSLQRLFQSVDSSTPRGAYQRGSHPLIIAIREFFRLAERESSFAKQALPERYVGDAVKKAIKHPADLVKMSSGVASVKVTKAAARGEFVDQLWIFDVIEVFNGLYVASRMPIVQEMSKAALQSVTDGGIQLLRALIDLVQDPSDISTAASANATVFEETSSLLNCLKRMLDYEKIIEVLLNRWSQKDWDGIIGSSAGGTTTSTAPTGAAAELFAMALYYQDLLKGLEVSIEKHCHVYKKAITGVLFQLNNYDYILRTFKTSNLASMVTIESEQKYESIVEALLKEYLNGWIHVANLLIEGNSRSTGVSPRDRLKTFAAEFDDLVKSQQVCAVPDAELKRTIIGKVRNAVVPPFITFYNMNQPLFVSMGSRIKLDPTLVETTINQLFQA